MKYRLTITFWVLFFLVSSISYSQNYKKRRTNTFAASAILGVNLSQVDGDESFGFNKQGVLGGLRGTILLTDRHQINIELLYSQRGSKLERQGSVFAGGDEYIKIDYIDIPIVFQVYPKKNNGKAYFEGGVYVSRNIRSTIEENVRDTSNYIVFEKLAPDFKSFEFGGLIGVGLKIQQHFGLGIRFSMALTPFYKDNDFNIPEVKIDPVEPVYKLQSYYLSIFGAYHF